MYPNFGKQLKKVWNFQLFFGTTSGTPTLFNVVVAKALCILSQLRLGRTKLVRTVDWQSTFHISVFGMRLVHNQKPPHTQDKLAKSVAPENYDFLRFDCMPASVQLLPKSELACE